MEIVDIKSIPSEVSIQIFEIIKNFNFNKVIKVMDFLDWKYVLPNPHCPDEDELSKTAFKHLIDVYNGFWEHWEHICNREKFFEYKLSTGGFEYSYWYDFDDEQHCFSIKFIIEEYNNF